MSKTAFVYAIKTHDLGRGGSLLFIFLDASLYFTGLKNLFDIEEISTQAGTIHR